jgi:type IX secretion system PorP/SprF family membrane protein
MKKVLTSVALVMSGFVAFAQQDAQFTQNFMNRLAVNPGYAGINGSICAFTLYRTQWVGFDGQPKTGLLSLDAPIGAKKNMGLGLTVQTDKLGFMNNFYGKLAYSYHIPLGPEGAKLGLGLELGAINNSVNGTWLAPDGTTSAGGNITDASIPLGNKAATTFDLGFGAFYNIPDKLYIGLASSHLPANNIGSYYDLARHYYITAGYDWAFTETLTLKPSIFVKSDAASTALDINVLLQWNNMLWGGVTYRLKDAIAPMIGYKTTLGPGTFKVGYSYDVTTSAIKTYSSGSHEIMLGYCFNVTPKPKVITRYYNVRFL